MRHADKIIAAQFLNRGTKTVEGLADLFAAVRAETLKECCAAVCGSWLSLTIITAELE